MILQTVMSILKYLILLIFVIISMINITTAFYSFKKPDRYRQKYPKVSVIVRSWNDGSVVERCIKEFLKQDYPKKNYEIIIFDDGSKDDTKTVCAPYVKDKKIVYVRFEKSRDRKAVGLDYIIKNVARGDIILETDVDFVLPKNWISEMVKPFSDQNVKAVTGRVMCGNWYRTWISAIRAVEDFWHFCTTMTGRYNLTGHGIIYGSSKAYRKSAWQEVGGHPLNIVVEDAGLFAKFSEKNFKIVNIPVTNLAEEVETLPQYFQERKRWAGGNVEAFLEYKKSLRKNPMFYYVLLSNFSIDGILFISLLMMFFEKLFFVPIFMTLLAIWIGLYSARAKDVFYLWATAFIIVNPLLQIWGTVAGLNEKRIKKRISWGKVWHHPTPLEWPTKEK